MYLDLNYTDLTNFTRKVQLMSGGIDLVAAGMEQRDICLHAWLDWNIYLINFFNVWL